MGPRGGALACRIPAPTKTAASGLGEVPAAPLGEAVRDGSDLLVGIPRSWPAVAKDRQAAAALRAAVSEVFEKAMADDYVAVSCRTSGADSAYYRLCPGASPGDDGSSTGPGHGDDGSSTGSGHGDDGDTGQGGRA